MVISFLLYQCVLYTLLTLTPCKAWTQHRNIIKQYNQPETILGDGLTELCERSRWGNVLTRVARGEDLADEGEAELRKAGSAGSRLTEHRVSVCGGDGGDTALPLTFPPC